MADNKKYYWLKFQKDFFTSKRIKKLRRLAGGDTFTIIYLKMQLLSLDSGGVIEYTGLESSFAEELALDIDEDADNVAVTVNYLLSCGLLEERDHLYLLPYVVENTGTDNEGLEKIREQTRQRVANYRAKQKLLAEVKTCSYCGETATGDDHIIPLSRGGSDDESNKTPCCISCNRIKNDKPLVDFLNNNRTIIKDDLIANNPKLSRLVKLCNVTNRYTCNASNALEIEKEKELEKDIEKEENNANKSRSRPSKHIFGNYKKVRLTDEELEKLKSDHSNYEEIIQYLDDYKEMTGKTYKSDYLAIKKWVVKAVEEKKQKANKSGAIWKAKEPEWLGKEQKSNPLTPEDLIGIYKLRLKLGQTGPAEEAKKEYLAMTGRDIETDIKEKNK